MTPVRHPTHAPLWGGTLALPEEVVTCPRCTGRIYYVDVIADTLDEQCRTWLCEDCAGTGEITLKISVKRVREFVPAPVRVAHRFSSKPRISA